MNPNRWSAAGAATTSERLAALQVADAVIRAQWPKLQATIRLNVGPNTLDALASFTYPGVLRVTMKYTGEPVAQSLPGRPTDLDPAAVARDRDAWNAGARNAAQGGQR